MQSALLTLLVTAGVVTWILDETVIPTQQEHRSFIPKKQKEQIRDKSPSK